ncbi:MAG: MarR family transcriptional regulator [Actinobacteria bacterium]|nr:MarR family transcriptional regulator [Actinomycetota bacterium]
MIHEWSSIGTVWGEGQIPAELSGFPGYLMVRLGHDASRRFREALAPEDLHPRDFGVLNIVAAAPGITQQQLHTRTAIDTSSMVAVIDHLEKLGYAERRPSTEDRRIRAIHLTPAGHEALGRARRIARELQGQVFGALTPDERTTLHDLLRKLGAANLAGPGGPPPGGPGGPPAGTRPKPGGDAAGG